MRIDQAWASARDGALTGRLLCGLAGGFGAHFGASAASERSHSRAPICLLNSGWAYVFNNERISGCCFRGFHCASRRFGLPTQAKQKPVRRKRRPRRSNTLAATPSRIVVQSHKPKDREL